MNRLEEFLQDLDNKNKIMLYLSVVIIGIIIYYNFNYSFLSSKIDSNQEKIKKLEKSLNFSIKNYNIKLAKLKKEYKNLLTIENEKLQDLEYLNKRINLSTLNVNDKSFYSLLEKILSKSYDEGLTPDFYIHKNIDRFKKYTIDINGSVEVCDEKNLLNFIKYLESRKYINNLSKFKLDINSTNYFIKYNIWGLK
ncbi:conserved hypothetical protein [Lebetimonas natsushimae]|uniref:Type IV pilus assembly protein PilN n=1 Tax=Lebetimonas natsushimae TaxID=1936991 RepID=A0A292YBE3_9BACT|nr:hypothetical protein [Lebetimonas natsushimae]GAX87078.1 conserved hypothetical protein [Lebetimonas natsushimae]